MREFITLECGECKRRNYRTSLDTTGGEKLSLSKYCRFCRKHTEHKTRRK
jgi:large subunit ribosomal protein L33